jgi:hypothetical protein
MIKKTHLRFGRISYPIFSFLAEYEQDRKDSKTASNSGSQKLEILKLFLNGMLYN